MERFYQSAALTAAGSWWIGSFSYSEFHQLAQFHLKRMNGEKMARVVDAMNRAGGRTLPSKRSIKWGSGDRRMSA